MTPSVRNAAPNDGRYRRARRRKIRVGVGVLLWIALLSMAFRLVHDTRESRDRRSFSHVTSWLLERSVPVALQFDRPVTARVGDPVFFRSSPRDLTLIGSVRGLGAEETEDALLAGRSERLRCEIYLSGHVGLNTGSRATFITVPQTASWVIKTLLPKEKLIWAAKEWNQTLLDHREEIFRVIHPVVEGLLNDLQPILTEDLPPALGRRSGKLTRIASRFQKTIIQKEFLPIVETELWPILVVRAHPTLEAVGKEIVARLPVWTLTWRLVYQSLPLTDDHLVREAWQEFVQSEVFPILREHVDDFFGAFRDVVVEASKNPRLGQAFRRSFDGILHDSELQHEVRLLFQELILDNPRFHQAMFDRWQSPETATAIDQLSEFIGPLMARLGDAILGTRGGGITPEFARVLRTQILQKDRRWVLIQPGRPEDDPLRPGHVFQAQVAQDE